MRSRATSINIIHDDGLLMAPFYRYWILLCWIGMIIPWAAAKQTRCLYGIYIAGFVVRLLPAISLYSCHVQITDTELGLWGNRCI
jgi:hypothetical protein